VKLFSFFKPIKSAPVARKRLHILLDADRSLNKHSDLVGVLREEIFSRFGRYATFDASTVRVREVDGAAVCTLVIDLEMPTRFQSTAMAAIGSVRAGQVVRAAEKGGSQNRKLALWNRTSNLEAI
jgi:septum formation topological specificity factor MinE